MKIQYRLGIMEINITQLNRLNVKQHFNKYNPDRSASSDMK